MYSNTTYTRNDSGRSLLHKVYGFMALALLVTAVVAWYVSTQHHILRMLLTNPWLVLGLFLVQLILVITLSAAIMRLRFSTALILLLVYSILVGVTFSTLFIMYTHTSLYTTFFVTSGMFAGLALYGYSTKADLSRSGYYAYMALFGLIIGFIVNLFLHNALFDYILTLVGVVIFSVLSAYDVQKIKQLSVTLQGNNEQERKIAIVGALSLYLDFINLFLMLLRLGGRRNNQL